MNPDRGLILKVSSFNALGLLIAVTGPLLLDPRLTSHVAFPGRQYRSAEWLLLLLCPLVFGCTYYAMRSSTTKRWHITFSCLFILTFGVVAAFLLPPERPHVGVLATTFEYSLLSFATASIRLGNEDYSYVADRSSPFAGRLERLKATVAIWQQITVSAFVGYLGFAIYWAYVLQSGGPQLVTKKAEIVLLEAANMTALVTYSIFVVIGPLSEAYRRALDGTRRLSSLVE